MTNADGVATVLFKLPMNSDVLMASVRGGIGGWDGAQLFIKVLEDEPVLVELVSEVSTVYLGEEVNILAKVMGRHSGAPMPQAIVSWAYSSLVIPPSLTDSNGEASVCFKPDQLGEHRLKASVDGDDANSKILTFSVLDPLSSPIHAQIQSVVAAKNPISFGESARFTATIVSTVTQQPMPNREVFVSVSIPISIPISKSIPNTTDELGQVRGEYQPAQGGSVTYVVKVRNPGGTVESGGMTVFVL
jgi:hypothetical protein